MAANQDTGKVREVRYCGSDYRIEPGQSYGKKTVWKISCGDTIVSQYCPTLSKAIFKIHEHATELGFYPNLLADGCSYAKLVSSVKSGE